MQVCSYFDSHTCFVNACPPCGKKMPPLNLFWSRGRRAGGMWERACDVCMLSQALCDSTSAAAMEFIHSGPHSGGWLITSSTISRWSGGLPSFTLLNATHLQHYHSLQSCGDGMHSANCPAILLLCTVFVWRVCRRREKCKRHVAGDSRYNATMTLELCHDGNSFSTPLWKHTLVGMKEKKGSGPTVM